MRGMPFRFSRTRSPAELAGYARREAQREAAAGRLDAACAALLKAEAVLARRASQTEGWGAETAAHALRELRLLRADLEGSTPGQGVSIPRMAQADVTAALTDAEQLLALGQLTRARDVADSVAVRLTEGNLPAHHPLHVRLARLRAQLEPAPPSTAWVPDGSRSTSVRTVSGGLPTLGRRR